jgi:nucleotide-binding universal stress UspA family protein
VSIAEQEHADLIMLASRGRGKLEILIGSVARRVVESTDKPVFMMPIPESSDQVGQGSMTADLVEGAL